ncbi:DUF2252 domain-containing protein [Ensifer sp. 2YAB10]|uniref:DUF2252 domain-containing protein n=1 Tax=unclassified Ensifer TaxID=2633371 RepID=UPI003F9297D9
MEMSQSQIVNGTHLASPSEKAAAGKALRNKVPRKEHGKWEARPQRPDPIDLLRRSDSDRMQELVAIRYGRMLQSPFAFYRGAAVVMADDLAQTPNIGMNVQACGDCHLLNFGGFATPERSIIFDINDFDETLPAPWEWDLKRLATSVVLAARANGMADHRGRDFAMACARKYREHMHQFSEMAPLRVWYTETKADEFLSSLPDNLRRSISRKINKASDQSRPELDLPKLAATDDRGTHIIDKPPLIFHPSGKNYMGSARFEHLFQAYRKSLSDDRRVLIERYRLVDAAIKVVGIGSVGRRCWIALMMSGGNDPLFLQFKEAVSSALEPYAAKCAYAHQGQRVVAGQRLMQPVSDIFLGWTTAPNGRHFYVRQLHDAKIKPAVETFDAEMLEVYAQACGWALARAHAKASDLSAMIGAYLGSSNDAFETAIGHFSLAYADQAEQDYAALRAAVKKGAVIAEKESEV